MIVNIITQRRTLKISDCPDPVADGVDESEDDAGVATADVASLSVCTCWAFLRASLIRLILYATPLMPA